MSYQSERDEFLSIMGSEGIRPEVARALLRESTTLQRLAEVECSSERADRDQVRCPAGRLGATAKTVCLCKDYGSFVEGYKVLDTPGPISKYADPVEGARRHISRNKALEVAAQDAGLLYRHGTIPRHMVKSAASTARVVRLCAAYGLTAHFGGDPRGCMLVVAVPSGRTNDWERRGITVPSQGYTAAQIDRISQ